MSPRRILLLLLAFPLYVLLLAGLSTLFWCLLYEPAEGWEVWRGEVSRGTWLFDEPAWWMLGVLPAALIATTQLLFIAPVLGIGIRVRKDGRPLWRSLIGAAFVAAVGATAIFLALTDVVGLLLHGQAHEYEGEFSLFLVILIPLVLSWLIWIPLLAVFCRRRPHRSTPGRLVGLLLGGTIVELLVIIPVDVLVRVRDQCYCSTASFHGTWLATLALLWLSGRHAAGRDLSAQAGVAGAPLRQLRL